jgi:hypothetical protein
MRFVSCALRTPPEVAGEFIAENGGQPGVVRLRRDAK